MIKSVAFFKRKPGIDLGQFQQHWREHHAPLVCRLPGIRGYIQSYAIESLYQEQEPAFDGYAEVWLDDFDALKAMLKSPLFPEVKADEARFIDGTTMGAFLCSESLPVDGPTDPGAIKAVRLQARPPGMDVDTFHAQWRTDQTAWARQAPALQRCVLNQALPQNYGRQDPPFDAGTVAWFGSLAALRQAGEAPPTGRAASVLMTEAVIVAR